MLQNERSKIILYLSTSLMFLVCLLLFLFSRGEREKGQGRPAPRRPRQPQLQPDLGVLEARGNSRSRQIRGVLEGLFMFQNPPVCTNL